MAKVKNKATKQEEEFKSYTDFWAVGENGIVVDKSDVKEAEKAVAVMDKWLAGKIDDEFKSKVSDFSTLLTTGINQVKAKKPAKQKSSAGKQTGGTMLHAQPLIVDGESFASAADAKRKFLPEKAEIPMNRKSIIAGIVKAGHKVGDDSSTGSDTEPAKEPKSKKKSKKGAA